MISIDPDYLQQQFELEFSGHRIHALPPKGGTRTLDVPWDEPWLDTARPWMAKQGAGFNFYFSPAVVKPWHARTHKGDMLESRWVWADLDPREGEPLEHERAAILELLTTRLPPGIPQPTFIVDSGRGNWAFWRLDKAHAFDGCSGEATRAFEDRLRGIGRRFGEYGDKSVKNINRIARLPSTVNPKTGAVAKVIAFNDTAHSLADFPVIVIERKPRREGSGDPIPINVFEAMLKATPYRGGPEGLDDRNDYDGWLNFTMAVHEAARGDTVEYLDAYLEWCRNDPEGKDTWTDEKIQAHWESFDPDANNGITRGSWFKLLRSLGHDDLVGWAIATTEFASDPLPPIPETEKRAACRPKRISHQRALRQRRAREFMS